MGAKALRYDIRRDIIKCRALCICFKRLLVVDLGSPDKPRGLSIQPCKSEKEEPYICHSSQGRSECLYLRIE